MWLLQEALKNGLILKKVHKEIHLKQSYRLKPYIDLNTKFRPASNNDFEKELFRLMNSSTFGKIYSKQ